MESKRTRVEEPEPELETEETIDPEALKELEERLKGHGIDRTSAAWILLFDERVVARLRDRSPSVWMREMRRRGLDVE